jgi:hypothetical protein
MFRTSQGPSSGSRELCSTEVTDIGSVLPFVSCMVSVWLHILTLCVCVCVCVSVCVFVSVALVRDSLSSTSLT